MIRLVASDILLSFAQFERELITERVRDKIAASKKKGMWMGGTVPLGYDIKDRKLVINRDEAKTVSISSGLTSGSKRFEPWRTISLPKSAPSNGIGRMAPPMATNDSRKAVSI
jgi:hypothetical protein